jgi:uncharacterized protein (DUF2141 family)
MLTTLFSILSFFQSFSSPSTLTVHVNGVNTAKGNVFVGLYRVQDEWPVFGKQYQGKIVKAMKGKNTIFFNNLPNGTYAVATYHDINANKKLDKNMFGMPIELYGFSNNARSIFSAPEFKDAKFQLNKSKTIIIQIK